jgi:hypothetical protein
MSFALQRTCFAATNITPAQWEQLKGDKAFSYKNDKEKTISPMDYKESSLQKFFRSFFEFFGSSFGNTLAWIIVISVAIYVIYKLSLGKDSFLFGRDKKQIGKDGPAEQDAEDIATTNWEALLQQATSNNDMRLAIRYSYMWLLQLLQQQQLIQYRNDKTNYEYYSELKETRYKQAFKQLSRQYEYAWYGKFSVPSAAFNDYLALFNNLKKDLKA